jgi:recombination protein RecR
MAGWTASMESLVEAFRKLPGVGPRTAERYAFYLLSQPASVSKNLSEAILRVKQTVGFCKTCFNLADGELCDICKDSKRDGSLVTVVEDHRSIRAFEKSGGYKGVYHVLLGALSPLDGIGPKELRIPELKTRVKSGVIREIILATDSDMEGESTALYLAKDLKTVSSSVKISRLAFGIPMGSSVEYADQVTLTRALEGRRIL